MIVDSATGGGAVSEAGPAEASPTEAGESGEDAVSSEGAAGADAPSLGNGADDGGNIPVAPAPVVIDIDYIWAE